MPKVLMFRMQMVLISKVQNQKCKQSLLCYGSEHSKTKLLKMATILHTMVVSLDSFIYKQKI